MDSISYERTQKTFHMDQTHFHDFIEVYYQVSGEKEYFIQDHTYHIISGDLIFISENTLHKTFVNNLSQMDRILVSINREQLLKQYSSLNLKPLFKIFDSQNSVFRLPPKNQHEVYALLVALGQCNHMESSLYPVNVLKLTRLIELLYYFNENLKHLHTLTDNHLGDTNLHTNKIYKYVNTHYTESLTLEDLADRFGLNKYYLCKLFKSTSGFTFTEYQNTVRIKKAVELLQHTTLNITEISEAVGYNDSSYFGKVFKKHMKVSPLKFRKQL